MRKNFWYCLTSAFFGSVRMLISVSHVQRLERRAQRQAADELGDHAELDQVFRLHLRQDRRRGRGRSRPATFSVLKPICRLPRRLRMMSSRPTNVPPQMNRICVVSIWMYCCSGCLRPPCGGMLATVPSSIFSSACCTPSPRHVAGDADVVLGLADLVDLVDVDDAALGGFEVVVGVLQELEQDVLDVFADVAGFGERRRVADGERDVEDARQRLGEQRLAGAGRADQQDVALVDLDVVRRLALRRRRPVRRCVSRL